MIFWRAMFGVKYQENLWKEKFEIFETPKKCLYFDMLKNCSHGLNRLGVKKSFDTQVVRVPKQVQESQQRSC